MGLEWDLAKARDWVVNQCWTEHKRNPGGPGIMVAPSKLGESDPPFRLICEAVEYLLGKNWVTAEYGRALGYKGPTDIRNLRLTVEAIAAIQDQIERLPNTPIGFISD